MRRSFAKELQVIVIADQIAVGVAGAHLLQLPFLARLEDARRSHKNCGLRIAGCGFATTGGVKQRHGLAIFFWVFKFAVNGRHPTFQSGFELRQVADERDECRVWRSGVWDLGHDVRKLSPKPGTPEPRPELNVHRFGCERNRSSSPATSRRRRFSSLTGNKTSPDKLFFNPPSRNGVPPSRPSCSRKRSVVSGCLSAFTSGRGTQLLRCCQIHRAR